VRNQWYGDHRDIVKWGVLVEIAHRNNIPMILQVAYLNPDDGIPRLNSELGEVEVAPEVISHFRDIHKIASLAEATGIRIDIFDREFIPRERQEYTAQIIDTIKTLPRPALVFLDPDTGMLDKPLSPTHVLPDEVRAIWYNLRLDDWLVLYQHASRQVDWADKSCREFKAACRGARVISFRSPNGAQDVVFFAVQRVH